MSASTLGALRRYLGKIELLHCPWPRCRTRGTSTLSGPAPVRISRLGNRPLRTARRRPSPPTPIAARYSWTSSSTAVCSSFCAPCRMITSSRLCPSSLARSASIIVSSLFIAGVSFRVLAAGMCRPAGFVFRYPVRFTCDPFLSHNFRLYLPAGIACPEQAHRFGAYQERQESGHRAV
ncbi:MAG: hypothetical protein RIR25_1740 [Verrucomicrobiota bacterium]